MPAGTRFMIEEGMLGTTLRNETIQEETPTDYYSFEIRNQFLHAVHPLGFIRKLKLEVDGAPVCQRDVYFVLRGQWIRADHLPDIADIYWYIGERAQIFVRKDGGIGPGAHVIRCTISASRLDQTMILDTRSIWPLREQTIVQEMRKEG